MKRMRYWGATLLLVVVALPADLLAVGQEGSRWFQVNTRLRAEYDDNVFLTAEDEQDTLKLIAELELFLNFHRDQTFFSLRYRPSYVYWTDREPDDDDLNHDVDVVLNHEFTPRLSLSLKDTFRIAELPELVDRGTTFRENNDFLYNNASGTASYRIAPKTRVDVAGNYITLSYEEDEVADLSDYDLYVGGLNLRHQVVQETAVQGELRYETIAYDVDDRDSDKVQIGGAVEQTFSPSLLGRARLGLEQKSFDDDGIDDSDEPYGDASLTLLPSPATRLSAGIGVTQTETDVYPFANQQRYQFFASAAHDWTARLSLFLSATYVLNELDAADAISSEFTPVDGDENIIQVSARLAYRLNRSNTVEAGWQLVDLDSDVREEYVRNRLNVGWKAEL